MLNLLSIGSGHIAELFLDAVHQAEGIRLMSVYSRTLDRARAFAAENGAEKYGTDLAELLADPEIGCVYIASPNDLHFPQTRQALLAGKHVICEKPFAGSRAEAEELFALAEERGLFLMEAISIIHEPHLEQVRQWLERVAPVHLSDFRFVQYSSRYDAYLAGQTANVFDPAHEGGALRDINVYNLHAMAWLFGRPDSGSYVYNAGRNGIDCSGTAVFAYEHHICTCMAAKDSCEDRSGRIHGEKGQITVDPAGNTWGSLDLRLRDGTVERTGYDPAANRLLPEVRDFVRMIREEDRESCRRWKEQTLLVMDLLDLLSGRSFEMAKL